MRFRLQCNRHDYDFVVFADDWERRQYNETTHTRSDTVSEAVAVARGKLLEAGGTGALLCEAVVATKEVLKLEPGVLPGGRYMGEGTGPVLTLKGEGKLERPGTPGRRRRRGGAPGGRRRSRGEETWLTTRVGGELERPGTPGRRVPGSTWQYLRLG